MGISQRAIFSQLEIDLHFSQLNFKDISTGWVAVDSMLLQFKNTPDTSKFKQQFKAKCLNKDFRIDDGIPNRHGQ